MNIRAFPDLTGYAPKDQAFHAYDDDTYDGAPDAGRQIVGWGATAEAAVANYHDEAADAREISG